MTTKKTPKTPAPARSRETGGLNPQETIDLLVRGVSGIVAHDREELANALLAYSLAAVTSHPYANQILSQVIERYASAGGITLDTAVESSHIDYTALVRGFGEYVGKRHFPPQASDRSSPSYAGSPEEHYGGR